MEETTMAILMSQPIPAKYRATCEFCGHDVDVRDLGVYQRTSGWVMNRAGGGGHGVSLPEREPRWAHGLCVERKTKGTLAQTTLW
jgi:hypothetical protein